MGAGQSNATEIGGSSMGFQVLRVYPNSPGSRAGLKAYFDFIIAIGNTRFNKENGSLREILKASVDQKLKMIVLNTRTKRTREVEIVPSTSWGGNGLLGVSIKHSSFERADERVWHVIEVEPGSPAFQAGFKANEDYVIGSDSILQESDDLYNLIEAHEGKALKLFLYNINTDNCREVICHPNSKWGGKGYLGCEFGHGLLHRIPYGGDAEIKDNLMASLINNEHAQHNEEIKAKDNPYTFKNQLAHPDISPLQQPIQPGHQLFRQALLGHQNQYAESNPVQQTHSPPTNSQGFPFQYPQQPNAYLVDQEMSEPYTHQSSYVSQAYLPQQPPQAPQMQQQLQPLQQHPQSPQVQQPPQPSQVQQPPQPSQVQQHPQPSQVQQHPQPSQVQQHPQPSQVQQHPQPSQVQQHPQSPQVQQPPQPSQVQQHPQPSHVQQHPQPPQVQQHPHMQQPSQMQNPHQQLQPPQVQQPPQIQQPPHPHQMHPPPPQPPVMQQYYQPPQLQQPPVYR